MTIGSRGRARLLLKSLVASLIWLAAKPAYAADDAAEDAAVNDAVNDAESLADAAETARAAGMYERCIEKDLASLEAEDKPTTRVHLVECADRAGQILLALTQLNAVLDEAIAAKNAEVARLASKRVEQLLKRLGVITIDPPPAAKDVVVTIDSRLLPSSKIGQPLFVDPGSHRIHAEGSIDGTPAVFESVRSLGEGERVTVPLMLTPRNAAHLTPGQLACMQVAKTDEEAFRCLPGKNQALLVRAAFEMGAYADTLSVLVLNPTVRASVSSPSKGWRFGASYLVDVISAASPDFVSTASPRGRDTRHGVSASAGYKPARFGVESNVGYSTEADYVSRSAGVAVLGDFSVKA